MLHRLALAALVPSLALAEPCTQATSAEPGDTVECSGVLIPEAMARDALQCRADLAATGERCALAAQQAAADLTLCVSERDATRSALDAVTRVVVPPPAPWYERPAVVWPAGIAVGAAFAWAVTR